MNSDRTSPWIRACKTEDLKNSNPLDFDYEDKKILITNVDNRIYATDRICTHAYADLSTGFLNESEKTVTCPLHLSSFDMNNGNALNLPAEEPLKIYKIKKEKNKLFIHL